MSTPIIGDQIAALVDAISSSEVLEGESEFIARTYAQSLLNVTDEQGKTEAVLDEIGEIVGLAKGDLRELLGSPIVPADSKESLVVRIFEGRADELTVRFLRVLARRNRLVLLREIYRQARFLWMQRSRRFHVEVSVAAALDDDQRGQLAEMVGKLVDGQPLLDIKVEPEIIGGLILRVGDDLYDMSVRTQLARLLGRLQEQKSYELQNRRDRFRHSA